MSSWKASAGNKLSKIISIYFDFQAMAISPLFPSRLFSLSNIFLASPSLPSPPTPNFTNRKPNLLHKIHPHGSRKRPIIKPIHNITPIPRQPPPNIMNHAPKRLRISILTPAGGLRFPFVFSCIHHCGLVVDKGGKKAGGRNDRSNIRLWGREYMHIIYKNECQVKEVSSLSWRKSGRRCWCDDRHAKWVRPDLVVRG